MVVQLSLFFALDPSNSDIKRLWNFLYKGELKMMSHKKQKRPSSWAKKPRSAYTFSSLIRAFITCLRSLDTIEHTVNRMVAHVYLSLYCHI